MLTMPNPNGINARIGTILTRTVSISTCTGDKMRGHTSERDIGASSHKSIMPVLSRLQSI
jgi:hypothetical protein